MGDPVRRAQLIPVRRLPVDLPPWGVAAYVVARAGSGTEVAP
jgi:hypothetical protein